MIQNFFCSKQQTATRVAELSAAKENENFLERSKQTAAVVGALLDVITIIELAEHIVKMKNGMSSLICHNSSSFFLFSHEYVSLHFSLCRHLIT